MGTQSTPPTARAARSATSREVGFGRDEWYTCAEIQVRGREMAGGRRRRRAVAMATAEEGSSGGGSGGGWSRRAERRQKG